MRLDRLGESPGVPGAFRLPQMDRFTESRSFNAFWTANITAVGTAAVEAGLTQQWATFGVALPMALAFLWIGFLVIQWDSDSAEIPRSAETTLEHALADAGGPKEMLIPAEVRTSWWFRVALGLLLGWAVFSTVNVIALGVGHHWLHYGWLAFVLAVISVIFSWLLLVIAWIGIVPPEPPDLSI